MPCSDSLWSFFGMAAAQRPVLLETKQPIQVIDLHHVRTHMVRLIKRHGFAKWKRWRIEEAARKIQRAFLASVHRKAVRAMRHTRRRLRAVDDR